MGGGLGGVGGRGFAGLGLVEELLELLERDVLGSVEPGRLVEVVLRLVVRHRILPIVP